MPQRWGPQLCAAPQRARLSRWLSPKICLMLQEMALVWMQRRLQEGLDRHASRKWPTHRPGHLSEHGKPRRNLLLLAGRRASQCPTKRSIKPQKDNEKSLYHPSPMGVDYITPNLWNDLYHPLNFPKSVKLPPKTILKNYSKSQKNHKIENPIVLDSKWVDLHSEHIIWYALIYFFTVALDLCFSS